MTQIKDVEYIQLAIGADAPSFVPQYENLQGQMLTINGAALFFVGIDDGMQSDFRTVSEGDLSFNIQYQEPVVYVVIDFALHGRSIIQLECPYDLRREKTELEHFKSAKPCTGDQRKTAFLVSINNHTRKIVDIRSFSLAPESSALLDDALIKQAKHDYSQHQWLQVYKDMMKKTAGELTEGHAWHPIKRR